jgi:hypothetical protein
MKLLKKVLRVKPIPNHIHHINIVMSTPRIPRAIDNPVIIIVIFTILLVIEIISCLFAHSLPSLSSRYINTLFLTSFAIKKVSHTIAMAQMRFITKFGSRSVLNQSITLVVSTSFQLEGATA